MREQHAQRHLSPTRIASRVEFGKIGLQRIVDRYLALLDELQNGSRRREALRQRCQIEDRVLGHGLGGRGGAVEARFAVELAGSERLTENDLACVADLDDGAGHPRCRNRILDELGDGSEIPFGHHGCHRSRDTWGRRGHCRRQRLLWRCVLRSSARRSCSEADQDDSRGPGACDRHQWDSSAQDSTELRRWARSASACQRSHSASRYS